MSEDKVMDAIAEDTAEFSPETEPAELPISSETAEITEITEPAEPAEITDPAETPEAPETEGAPESTEPAPEEAAAEEPAPVQEMDASGKRTRKPYHERYYLRYGDIPNAAELDLAGTKAFLQGIGFDGGELHQARVGKDFAGALEDAPKVDGQSKRCSYCGREISGVEFFRTPDGRTRCTTCSSTVVKAKAEIWAIYDRVVANLDNFFGATLNVPIGIEVLDERKLKRKIKCPISEVDDKSVLILGVAVNKKKDYTVYLENGAPRISLIATFAHELTHIWQYTHWDNVPGFKKCPPGKRLLIYEGMAKWAEIQYLYLIGETEVAKREEAFTRLRQDEYGIGFCIYEDYFPLTREVMGSSSNPFTPGKYPFD